MRGDSEISSVSMLNQLWSGESKKVDRCNSESFSLINKRITIGVAIQEEIFRAYYDYSKKTAKSSGLIGRFCISYPESTQGFRTKSEIPEDTHYLNAYNKRIKSVLDMPMHINQYGEIQFDTLVLSDDARTVRDNFYEEIEKNLKKYGYWRDVSDFANKSPEIACRFAALFHIYECGVEKKEISELHMKQAVALTEWYLGNTKRFNEIFLLSDPLTKEAVKLADWLFSHCDKIITSAISTRDISRNCPKNIRRSAVRDEILILLEKNGYIKIKQEGKTKIVQINPKFLNKASAYDD
jgi:putative DNA primase/helicase